MVSLCPCYAHSSNTMDSGQCRVAYDSLGMCWFHTREMICNLARMPYHFLADMGNNWNLESEKSMAQWTIRTDVMKIIQPEQLVYSLLLTEIAIAWLCRLITIVLHSIEVVWRLRLILCAIIGEIWRNGREILCDIFVDFVFGNVGHLDECWGAGVASRWWRSRLRQTWARCVRCIVWAESAGGRYRWRQIWVGEFQRTLINHSSYRR